MRVRVPRRVAVLVLVVFGTVSASAPVSAGPPIDQLQGVHRLGGPSRVRGFVSGDAYDCPRAFAVTIDWAPVSERTVDAFPAIARCVRAPGGPPTWWH